MRLLVGGVWDRDQTPAQYYDVIDSFDNVWRSGKAVFVELNEHRPWFVPIFACYSVGF